MEEISKNETKENINHLNSLQSNPIKQMNDTTKIQKLCIQLQQYQKEYNELVDYLKNTPNLPIKQLNQIEQQLNQLNTSFVLGKNELGTLCYEEFMSNGNTCRNNSEVKINLQNNEVKINLQNNEVKINLQNNEVISKNIKNGKSCPHCGSEIFQTARKCKFCGEWVVN